MRPSRVTLRETPWVKRETKRAWGWETVIYCDKVDMNQRLFLHAGAFFRQKGHVRGKSFFTYIKRGLAEERHWVVVKMTLFNRLLWLQALTFSTQIWQLEMEAGGWRTKKSSRVHCFCLGFFFFLVLGWLNDSDLQSVIFCAFCNHFTARHFHRPAAHKREERSQLHIITHQRNHVEDVL